MEKPKLGIDRTPSIKYEASEDFKTSIHYETYQNAHKRTQEIVSETKKYWDNKEGKTGNGTNLRNQKQICNILFFTGDRGTGKTSVMLSYMEFLKDYYRNSESQERDTKLAGLQFDGEACMFTGIEYIDASLMDGKEGILDNVLSKMLEKWRNEEKRSYGNIGLERNEDYAFKKRQIQMQFSKVYECLKNVRSKGDLMEKDSDAYIDTLQKMSLTSNLKQSFEKLIEQYLEIMTYSGINGKITKKNHFLIISIDDLDMNIKNGFLLLDQIRKYLMVPNVIVLMSANYEQLEKICINHYSEEFEKMIDVTEKREYIVNLSREYLEKIVPAQRRIMLNSGKKWKFFEQEEVEISYAAEEEARAPKISQGGTLQRIVRKQMEECLGVCFYEKSKCLYYLTPDTMRELNTWINKMNELSSLKKVGKENYNDACNDNLKWFLNEEFPWLCKKYLGSEAQKMFTEIELLETEGQIHQVKAYFAKSEKTNQNRPLVEILADSIYNTLSEQVFSALSIIYFSVCISARINRIKGCVNAGELEKEREQLLHYYQDGIFGGWEKMMLPPMIAMRKDDKESGKFLRIARSDIKKMNGCLKLTLEGEYNNKEWKSVSNLFAKNGPKLINYQYMLLFYQLRDNEELIDVHKWKKVSQNELDLSGEYQGVFSLSGFVLNIMNGAKLVEEFVKEVPQLLYEGPATRKKGDVEHVLPKAYSIIEELKSYQNEPLLPINNLEYVIKLGKTLQNRLGTGAVKQECAETVIAQIQNFFEVLSSSLKEYDTMFETGYQERFLEFKLTQKILGNEKDMEFLKMLAVSIMAHTVPYTQKSDEDEWSGGI
ncbi:MAG: hypothetical protein J6K53_11775 [Roseburia sp.]|nr:hypothetical protein [Roseburia sp.]